MGRISKLGGFEKRTRGKSGRSSDFYIIPLPESRRNQYFDPLGLDLPRTPPAYPPFFPKNAIFHFSKICRNIGSTLNIAGKILKLAVRPGMTII